MFVRDSMTKNPVTITAEVSVSDALRLMREKKVRRLPVLDKKGKLVGIVSDHDLLYASPSPVTSLSVWEMHELLHKLKVQAVMTKNVITASEDMPLEEAARIMADRKIGGMPVMNGDNLAGIITETDVFKTFLAQLGARRSGVRITVATSGAKGTVAKITSAILSIGGDIVGLGLNEPNPPAQPKWLITFKVQDVPADKLAEIIRPVVDEIVDIRET